MSHWVDLAPLDSLEVGSAKAFRRAGEQVAVFRVGEDELFAIDNRCPHEGYAMIQGYVQKQTVTCAWHNFKFDLKSGACLMGDEDIRTFPVRCLDGRLEVEILPPDPQQEQTKALESLETALLEGRAGQCARDMVRALHHGLHPVALAFELCRFDARRARYGIGHGTPAAVDALRLEPLFPGPQAALPLLTAARMVSLERIRLPARRSHGAIESEDATAALRRAVESEDLAQAVGLFHGLWEGQWQPLRSLFFTLCSDHFYSYGHRLIYLVKVDELLGRIEAEGLELDGVEHLIEGLLVGIVNGTRHDLLPPWRSWMRACAPHGEAVPRWAQNEGAEPEAIGRLVAAWTQADEAVALSGLVDALDAGLSAESCSQALILAASIRMLAFNTDLDGDPTLQDDWLNVSHCLTTAVALNQAITRGIAGPEDAIRKIFLCARFVWGMQPLDKEALPALPDPQAMTIDAFMGHLAGREEQHVLAGARHFLEQGNEDWVHRLMDASVRDEGIRPIVAVHILKTLMAALDAHSILEVDESWPVLAALRMWATGHREFNSERLIHEAIVNVVDGKIPRTLT